MTVILNKNIDKPGRFIRRAIKRVGSSKKVWCSKLGSTKKFHETPLCVNQKLFGAIFALVCLNYTTLSQSESSNIFVSCEWCDQNRSILHTKRDRKIFNVTCARVITEKRIQWVCANDHFEKRQMPFSQKKASYSRNYWEKGERSFVHWRPISLVKVLK